jgi:tricorn protease
MKYTVLTAAAVCLSILNVFSQQKGYYRTPSISKDMVIFSAEGDLWKWDMSKSQASRLTTNPGIEANPVISPDGKQVVFTGEYEGYSELYLMSTAGSVPKRLSFRPGSTNHQTCGLDK